MPNYGEIRLWTSTECHFLVLPTRKDLPDYYQKIAKPIDFRKMKDNITKHKYHGMDDLEADVMLLCQNTHTYNVEGSQIYNDATQLVQVFKHYRALLESSELDQSDNEGSLHSTLYDTPFHRVQGAVNQTRGR
ncbi:probable global transcription activator SNF2L2 isoform X2 [Dysidea avara]|uniref:probable global transcription activator SNF2L2 isoform X2 n=1 Tax=Dysidea avara TaxID=196820 RepID=UPI00332D74F2